ncbi:hypothetical protein [Streptomyces sp. NPDC054842]
MNVSLFPLPAREVDSGFAHVMSRYYALESEEAAELCDLGEDSGVVEQLLVRAGAGDEVLAAVSGENVLGDDGAGTVCTFLPTEEVARIARFFSTVSVHEVMQSAPEVLSGILRGGIPAGYLDDLRETLDGLWKLYVLADREGLCVAQVYEG